MTEEHAEPRQPAQMEEEDSISLLDLLVVFAKHKKKILLVPILAGGIRDQPVYPVRSFDQSDAPEVLAWAGYEEAEIEALCRAGAVG